MLAGLTTDIIKTDVEMGMGFTVVSSGCVTRPPLGGALTGLGHGHLPARTWGDTSFLTGASCLFGARFFQQRQMKGVEPQGSSSSQSPRNLRARSSSVGCAKLFCLALSTTLPLERQNP